MWFFRQHLHLKARACVPGVRLKDRSQHVTRTRAQSASESHTAGDTGPGAKGGVGVCYENRVWSFVREFEFVMSE